MFTVLLVCMLSELPTPVRLAPSRTPFSLLTVYTLLPMRLVNYKCLQLANKQLSGCDKHFTAPLTQKTPSSSSGACFSASWPCKFLPEAAGRALLHTVS